MGNLLTKMITDYMIAFGVVLGASLMAGIAATLTLQPPSFTMQEVAKNVKIWAVVVAIGGTIDPLRLIESNVIDGQLSPAIKQILQIISAFMGAQAGTALMLWLSDGGNSS
ncbi:YtrH family sporulation protein [Chengkuizengella axinellae]|uniref:YtrH family sporulation protein n=1 Tax=Chengkuizengella axinellae TaxID=3064388 RepID=A0ABT9IYL2_9BACL|nr:YtrH family sporulation protein [Chengkuizengella sp. 2205SS18-9]MDP5274407.1 YtrH family sporulation protein [Chengkuizengella sp. 2205SS18-9]